MKRIGIIIILPIYLILSIGVLASSHFCMGFESDKVLFSFKNKGCDCEVVLDEVGHCCHDELDIIQLDDDQQVSFKSYSTNATYALLFAFTINERSAIKKQKCSSCFDGVEEPPSVSVPLYKKNCSFTFYG